MVYVQVSPYYSEPPAWAVAVMVHPEAPSFLQEVAEDLEVGLAAEVKASVLREDLLPQPGAHEPLLLAY